MTTGQRIRMEARAAGRSEGRTEGLSEGRTEGRTEEARRMLARLLTRRFGVSATEVDERLQAATLEQLEAWVDRILDVESMDALFAGD